MFITPTPVRQTNHVTYPHNYSRSAKRTNSEPHQHRTKWCWSFTSGDRDSPCLQLMLNVSLQSHISSRRSPRINGCWLRRVIPPCRLIVRPWKMGIGFLWYWAQVNNGLVSRWITGVERWTDLGVQVSEYSRLCTAVFERGVGSWFGLGGIG